MSDVEDAIHALVESIDFSKVDLSFTTYHNNGMISKIDPNGVERYWDPTVGWLHEVEQSL